MPISVLARVDTNLLVTLGVLLEERSVTRAAERLGVTQSAASHRLRHLRELFEDELLVSGASGLVLSDRAESLQAPLAEALRQLASVLSTKPTFDPATSRRRFVLAASDYGEFAIIPHMLPELQARAPHVDLVIEPPAPGLAARLERSEVDAAIGPPLEGAGIRQRALEPEGFVIALREGHPALENKITTARYLRLNHLLVAPRGRRGGIVDDLLASRAQQRRVALRIGHFSTAPFIVAQTDLAWTAPERFVREASRYTDLATRPLPFDVPPFRAILSWHERSENDPGQRWFRAQLCLSGRL